MESEETSQVDDLNNPTSPYQTSSDDSKSPTYIFEFASASFEDSDIEEHSDFEDVPVPVSDSDEPIFLRSPSSDVEESGVQDISGNNSSSTWREGTTPPNKLSFTGKSGLQVQMEDSTPFDYLHLMVTDEMVTNLVTETNRYATQTLESKEFTHNSRYKKWVDVTIEEMWAFLGLVVSMGLIVIDNIEEYWSGDPMYNLPFFSSVMQRDKFNLIMSFFHVCNSKDEIQEGKPGYDPIFKIKNFFDSLIYNFKTVFYPGDKVTVDEGMIAWTGPLSFRAYDADKQEKYGIKLFELCDSSTGYCSNLEIYTGKTESSSHGAAFDIVHRLISPYLGCGRTLYVDSSYTSPDLFTFLRENGTMACGAMKKVVKNGPPKAIIPKLKRDDQSITKLTNGHLNVIMQLTDGHEACFLTTAHGVNKIATGKTNPKTNEPIMKFEAVYDYHQSRGAVDRSGMMVAFNTFKRRSPEWWKKTFFHLFNLAVLNAYMIHRATEEKTLPHRIFRRELAKQLVQRLIPVASIPLPKLPQGCGNSSLFKFSAQHFPKRIERKPGKDTKTPQRNCVVCTLPDQRKRTCYECPACNVGLHADPCFRIYHSKRDYKGAFKRFREQNEQPATDDEV